MIVSVALIPYVCYSMWQKTLHMALMMLVYLSSTSMLISKHYCSDQLMGASFMVEAETCHDSAPVMPACPSHTENKKDCCSSESHLVKTELNHDLHQPQLKTFDFSELLPVLIFVYLDQMILEQETLDRSITEWDPPSPDAVDLLRIQRFLC